MLLHDEPDVLRLYLEEENGLQIHEWLDYDPDGRDELVLNLLDHIFANLLKHPVEKLIVDTRQARGAFSPAVLTFVQDVQFPRILAETPLRFVVTIKPRDELSRIATRLWEAQVRNRSRLIMQETATMEEARAWLQEVESFRDATS